MTCRCLCIGSMLGADIRSFHSIFCSWFGKPAAMSSLVGAAYLRVHPASPAWSAILPNVVDAGDLSCSDEVELKDVKWQG